MNQIAEISNPVEMCTSIKSVASFNVQIVKVCVAEIGRP